MFFNKMKNWLHLECKMFSFRFHCNSEKYRISLNHNNFSCHCILLLRWILSTESNSRQQKTNPAHFLSLNHIVCQIRKTNIQFHIELSLAISQFIQMVCATMRWNFSQQPSLNTFHQQLCTTANEVLWIQNFFFLSLHSVYHFNTVSTLIFISHQHRHSFFSTPTYCITSRYMVSKLLWIFASDLLESWNALSFWYRQTRTRSTHEYKEIEWDND